MSEQVFDSGTDSKKFCTYFLRIGVPVLESTESSGVSMDEKISRMWLSVQYSVNGVVSLL